MNIFEGARRISILFALLILVGGAIGIYNVSPHVIIKYKVIYFGLTPIKISTCNESVDALRYNNHVTPSGKEFTLRTCFRASKSQDGRLLIPYSEAPNNMVYMGSEYSEDVRAYTESVANSIVPAPEDVKEAEEEYSRQLWSKRWEGLGWLAGALVAYWLCMKMVGWIVRGFMGIPAGHDFKTSALKA